MKNTKDKNMKKIDIFTRELKNKNGMFSFGHWVYECTTMQYKTCNEAKARFCSKYRLSENQVKCSFNKG